MDSGTALVEELRQQKALSPVPTARSPMERGIRFPPHAAEAGSREEMKLPGDASAHRFVRAESGRAGSTASDVRDHQDLQGAVLKASADLVSEALLTADSAAAGIADSDGVSVGASDLAGDILTGVTDGATHTPTGV